MGLIGKALGFAFVVSELLATPVRSADSLAPVVVSSFPTQKTVAAGVSVRFEIEATGASPLYYHWIFHDKVVSTNAWFDISFEGNDGSQDVLNIIVYNRDGNTFRQCGIKALTPPKVTVGTSEVTVVEGDALSIQPLNIQPQDTLLLFQWFKDGVEIPGGTNYVLRRDKAALADSGT